MGGRGYFSVRLEKLEPGFTLNTILGVSQDHGHAIGHGANTIRMLPIRALRSFSCYAENVFQFVKSAGNSQIFSRRHRASS